MCRFLQVFCAIFSGVLLALAIPNEHYLFGEPLIGLFALLPLYLAVSSAQSYRSSFWICALQALVTHLLSSFWLGNFHGFALFTLGASAFGTAGYHGLFGWLYHWLFSKYTSQGSAASLSMRAGRLDFAVFARIFMFASLYTIWEWCKSNGFLGYPWGTLSMTAYRWPLVTQIAAITGCYGVTFLFALFAATLAEGLLVLRTLSKAITPRRYAEGYTRTAKVTAAFFLLALCYGLITYTIPRQPVKLLNAVLVQQNKDPWLSGDKSAIDISTRLTEEGLASFSAAEKEADVVVWSESVLGKNFPDAIHHYTSYPKEKSLIAFIREKKVPFIIGAPYTFNREKHQTANATILIDKNGKYAGNYAKLHLVPFAERIPGVEYEWVRNFIHNIAGFSYGWTQGYKATLFEIPLSTAPLYDAEKTEIVSLVSTAHKADTQPSVRIGTPICFDDAFGEVCRRLYLAGSEVFINLTNDAWSQTQSAEMQHFIVASYRAIEYRTTLARSTNAGFTCVVSPTGSILQSVPLFEERALAAEIPVYERKMTVYARLGDWLPILLAVLCTLLFAVITLSEYDRKNESFTTERMKALGIWFTTKADMSEWNY